VPMRTFVAVLFGALALGGSASANNVALDPAAGGLASIYSVSGEAIWGGVTYSATNAIDGSTDTEWVGPGMGSSAAPMPYLLIDLGQLYPIYSVTVDGVGNSGLFTSFNVYVGGLADLLNISQGGAQGAAILVLQVMNQADGAPGWSLTGLVPGGFTNTEYVLYEGVNDTTLSSSDCAGDSCYPGSAQFDSDESPISGQDDGFATEILANTPEPSMIGLVSVALLGLGFARRFRKSNQ